jgi:hypothetical protein
MVVLEGHDHLARSVGDHAQELSSTADTRHSHGITSSCAILSGCAHVPQPAQGGDAGLTSAVPPCDSNCTLLLYPTQHAPVTANDGARAWFSSEAASPSSVLHMAVDAGNAGDKRDACGMPSSGDTCVDRGSEEIHHGPPEGLHAERDGDGSVGRRSGETTSRSLFVCRPSMDTAMYAATLTARGSEDTLRLSDAGMAWRASTDVQVHPDPYIYGTLSETPRHVQDAVSMRRAMADAHARLHTDAVLGCALPSPQPPVPAPATARSPSRLPIVFVPLEPDADRMRTQISAAPPSH